MSFFITTFPTTNWARRFSFQIFSKKKNKKKTHTSAEKHFLTSSRAFPIVSGTTRLFQYSDAEMRMHMGSRQFHYTESSCFSSGSRPLCRLPSTENWKHGTNNIMCYSNFAPGLVIRPSAVTTVADRADVSAASLPVCSLATSHWSSPGCMTVQPSLPSVQNFPHCCSLEKLNILTWHTKHYILSTGLCFVGLLEKKNPIVTFMTPSRLIWFHVVLQHYDTKDYTQHIDTL